uniref:Uncharacterized protein n=1 Tax=Nelumbo nucifera TaxID=4432 RepID=A0A822Z2I8_NELNU|nr:TPA_asm: hypothetical protein HUJ06_006348 [Nelumbo nucifera]DAD35711.1 TPA_asm: hypothetical protein HUJ06_006351 [Nelumbo nucifera]
MVETISNLMLFSSSARATARTQSAQLSSSSDSILCFLHLHHLLSFSFGSCKEGWYYRCLGVDP